MPVLVTLPLVGSYQSTPENHAGYSGVRAREGRNDQLRVPWSSYLPPIDPAFDGHRTAPREASMPSMFILSPETVCCCDTFYFVFCFSKWWLCHSVLPTSEFSAMWPRERRCEHDVQTRTCLFHVCQEVILCWEPASWRGILILGMAFCMCRKTVKTFPMGRDKNQFENHMVT